MARRFGQAHGATAVRRAVTGPEDLAGELLATGYVADAPLSTGLFLALSLDRPLLVEGPAGVGKSSLAGAYAQASGRRLVRLQCYEGLDAHTALYEWDLPRQLLAIRAAEGGAAAEDLFSDRYLLRRPLLEAILSEEPVVLLVDEVDRADEGFEAFLLEVLGDWQVSVPERGTLTAKSRPLAVVTSNRTRELSDALRRRCLYAWVDYPEPERERQIVRARLPGVPDALSAAAVAAMGRLRQMPLDKLPGVSETLDWCAALMAVGGRLDAASARATLGAVVKDGDDLLRVAAEDPATWLGSGAG